MLKQWVQELYNGLIWGNVFMALSAVGWILVTWNYLALPYDPIIAILGFALAILFYTRDRLDPQELSTDIFTFIERTQWVQRYRRWLYGSMAVAAGVALYCIYLRPTTWLPLLAGVGFALTYTLRWIPYKGERWSWKQIPGLKTPYVALLWTILTVFTPAAGYGLLGEWRIWQVAVAVFALIFCQILLNDLRDINGDMENKVYSLPVLMGDLESRRLGIEVLAFPGLIAFALWHPAFFLSSLYTMALLILYRRKTDPLWRPFIELQGLIAGLLSGL